MLKKFLFFILLLLLILFTACSSEEEPSSTNDNIDEEVEEESDSSKSENSGNSSNSSNSEITIGLSMSDMSSVFFQGEHDKFVEVAEENGVNVVAVFADGDANQQLNQIKDLIASDVDAIVCVPVDTEAIVSSVEDAKNAKIPFIAMGRMPKEMEDVSYAVAVDNFQTAEAAAEAMKKNADNAGIDNLKVIELIGDMGDQNAVERHEGFQQKAEELGMEIVSEIPTEWNPENAYSRFNDAAQVNEFDAVYVPSDMLLSSVISVLQSQNKLHPIGDENHVIIASIDGDPNAITHIRDKHVDLTINTDAFDFGEMAALGAIELAKGNTPEDQIVYVPNIPISAENIDELGNTIWGNVYAPE